jgi:hypothetical protein
LGTAIIIALDSQGTLLDGAAEKAQNHTNLYKNLKVRCSNKLKTNKLLIYLGDESWPVKI